MTRRFPLQPLLDLANERADLGAQRLALLKLHWQSQEDKLQQLYLRREEYRQRLADTLANGVEMPRLRDFQVFLQKLEEPIRQQQIAVQQAQFSWEECQGAWLEQRRKQKTFDILKQHHQHAETQRENRLEQREHDEYARNRIHQNREY